MVIKSYDEQNNNEITETRVKAEIPLKLEIVWRNVVLMVILHIYGVYAFCISVTDAKWQTWTFGYIIGMISAMGVQAGAHRLWSHKAYKAKLPLRILLAFSHTMAFQNSIYEWCRDHRVHHKFSETNADPHNSKRGFFFSHVGWLLCKKHPDVKLKGMTIDMSDLMADPVVRFEHRFYMPLVIVIWGLMPTYIPYILWNESLSMAFSTCVMFRYCYSLNVTWLVNSAAHKWGNRPYDQRIEPREATVRHLLQGEGFHNYHHTFPWDYSASELGPFQVFNPATAFIDFFAFMGLAYDLKSVSTQIIQQKIKRNLRNDKLENYSMPNAIIEWIFGLLINSWFLWTVYLMRTLILVP